MSGLKLGKSMQCNVKWKLNFGIDQVSSMSVSNSRQNTLWGIENTPNFFLQNLADLDKIWHTVYGINSEKNGCINYQIQLNCIFFTSLLTLSHQILTKSAYFCRNNAENISVFLYLGVQTLRSTDVHNHTILMQNSW